MSNKRRDVEPYSGGLDSAAEEIDSGCSMVTKGFCAQHGVQEERREIDRNRINDLIRDFKEYKRNNNLHVSRLCTFKNRVIGCSLLGILVITGSFAYTYTTHISSNVTDQNFILKLERVAEDVSTNKVNTAVLLSQLETTNNRLGEVIDLMNEQILFAQKERNDG